MPEFSIEVWLLMGGVAAAAVVGVVHLIASVVATEVYLHNVKVEVLKLREERRRELAEAGFDTEEVIEAEIVEDDEPGRAAA